MQHFAAHLALAFLYALALAPHDLAAEHEGAIDAWFPRLRAGMWVEVEGARTPEGVLEATEIKMLDGELDEWQIETHVASVDQGRTTLVTTLGTRVVATPKTVLKDAKGKPGIVFADVGVDDCIEVEGRLQKDGTLLADEVEIEQSKKKKPDLQPKNKHEVRARIESVDAENLRIVLMGMKVQLGPKTRNKTPRVD